MTDLEAKLIIENELKQDVVIIKRFLGGMSNYTYHIQINGANYTYRIPGFRSEVFINREVEFKNLELIKPLNINCENIYFNTTNGHKLAKYIEEDYLADFDYTKISAVLKKIHNSGLKATNNYDKIERLNYYESLLNTKQNNEYLDLKKQFLKLNDIYKPENLVLTHGDAQRSNWIVSNNVYYLLDWEYSANNDFYYDIACFGNQNFDDALKLLDVYLERKANTEELNRLYFNRFFQCLQWYNIALFKEENGLSKMLNIDFFAVSKKYLVLANNLLKQIYLKRNKE